jgi:uncharacterized protein YndB with AHSA1/START domain
MERTVNLPRRTLWEVITTKAQCTKWGPWFRNHGQGSHRSAQRIVVRGEGQIIYGTHNNGHVEMEMSMPGPPLVWSSWARSSPGSGEEEEEEEVAGYR